MTWKFSDLAITKDSFPNIIAVKARPAGVKLDLVH